MNRKFGDLESRFRVEGKFKGILYIGDPLKGSFRGVSVRDPLSRFLSSPFIIRVPFFLIHSFNKETPN